ncbi:MAG TPA: OmpA family protein [Stellaceae bacterium]|nr:OmpA family protein [Stellaceae bacterium]
MKRWANALVVAAAMALGGCADETRIVLLDSGAPSAVTITNDAGVVKLDRPGEAVELSSRKSVPKPVQLSTAEIGKDWSDALAFHPAEPRKWILYFNFDSAELTANSRGDLTALVAAVAARPAAEVAIIGFTDRSGPESYNRDLGLRRAEAIRADLTTAGVPATAISVTSYGANDPLVESRDVYEPRNRRTEITVR